ncbi:MAG: 2-oxoglutarate dehydrogenase [Rothia mucilaginosa]|uniref:2-oxoglutarate dehydrogenase n=2 Tax=Rothia mucilaginosa TaxID=43675 RepID=A0A943T7D5_9MICC|nr:2-oxoglutarate dehydrogenase [Rothia mucilaginosa]
MAQQGIIPHGAEEPANAMGRAATLTRQQKTAGAPTQLEPATVAQLLDAYRKQNLGTLLGVLTRRPGEFARQLGRLSRLFPQHVAAIAEAFASVGRTLPLDELVRLHNRYSNAARGVGEKLSLDNSRMLHLIQAPALSREGAGHLLMAIELCMAGRLHGLTVSMPSTEAFAPAEQSPSLGSCNPALNGALNAFEPIGWEPFSLNGSQILLASGVRDIPDGYELSLWLLDDDYRCRARVERGAPRVCVASFHDEEVITRTVEETGSGEAGLVENYRVEEYAELDFLNAMDRQVRYVAVTAKTGEPLPTSLDVPEPWGMDSLSPFVDGRFILPDVRAAEVTSTGGLRTRTHSGMLPVVRAPGRTVCAVIDLYKQRINTPGVGIPAGLSVEDEERTMQLILSALNGYLPLTNRALMSLAGATVEVR